MMHGTENENEIRRRLTNARNEIARSKEFDFNVLNDSLERAALEIEAIVKNKFHKSWAMRQKPKTVSKISRGF